MKEKRVFIPNISCGHCVSTIKRELEEIESIDTCFQDINTDYFKKHF